MLSPNMDEVGPKNAARIWGFVSKFVMLDRLARTLFGADFHPGLPMPRRRCEERHLGTAAKVVACFCLFCWMFLKRHSVARGANSTQQTFGKILEDLER
jgi:hypothetical protein